MLTKVISTVDPYSLENNWTLVVHSDEYKIRKFFLGNSFRFCFKMLHTTPLKLVEEIGPLNLGDIRDQRKLGKYIRTKLRLTKDELEDTLDELALYSY